MSRFPEWRHDPPVARSPDVPDSALRGRRSRRPRRPLVSASSSPAGRGDTSACHRTASRTSRPVAARSCIATYETQQDRQLVQPGFRSWCSSRSSPDSSSAGPISLARSRRGTASPRLVAVPSRLRWFLPPGPPDALLVSGHDLRRSALTADTTRAPAPRDRSRPLLCRLPVPRGPVGVAGILVASIALAVGALLGRTVPTILLTLILVFADDRRRRASCTARSCTRRPCPAADENYVLLGRRPLSRQPPGAAGRAARHVRGAHQRLTRGYSKSEFGPQYPERLAVSSRATRYRDVETREAAAPERVSALVFLGVAAFAVIRRRPR